MNNENRAKHAKTILQPSVHARRRVHNLFIVGCFTCVLDCRTLNLNMFMCWYDGGNKINKAHRSCWMLYARPTAKDVRGLSAAS
jgi:hypothetical protein